MISFSPYNNSVIIIGTIIIFIIWALNAGASILNWSSWNFGAICLNPCATNPHIRKNPLSGLAYKHYWDSLLAGLFLLSSLVSETQLLSLPLQLCHLLCVLRTSNMGTTREFFRKLLGEKRCWCELNGSNHFTVYIKSKSCLSTLCTQSLFKTLQSLTHNKRKIKTILKCHF